MARKFLLTRLHSLAGIFAFRSFPQIERLQSIPFLPVLEVLIIALPLIYHAVFGLYIAFIAQNNAISYSYSRNWMFVLQRMSGVVTLVFVVYHLWAFRFSNLLFGTPVDYHAVQAHLENPAIFVFYIIGVVATTFHFSNGLWGALITWGVTVGPKAQRRSAVFTYGVFAVLSISGIATLFSF
ncbi:succinate dehydrogenase [Ammoniphilus sp. 3BR4]|uniref:succinate dehydrogenase n=1 Tax=Ammoniphilus sp. 3BR4 TaxID=3158265 RepID=UPI00346744F2